MWGDAVKILRNIGALLHPSIGLSFTASLVTATQSSFSLLRGLETRAHLAPLEYIHSIDALLLSRTSLSVSAGVLQEGTALGKVTPLGQIPELHTISQQGQVAARLADRAPRDLLYVENSPSDPRMDVYITTCLHWPPLRSCRNPSDVLPSTFFPTFTGHAFTAEHLRFPRPTLVLEACSHMQHRYSRGCDDRTN